MELLELMRTRRSIRKYTDAPVSEENITKILQAGMLSATGKGIRPWEFIVVTDKDVLQKMADCRAGSVKMLKEAPCAIVVLGNEDASDVWTEDCSAVMSNMHLMLMLSDLEAAGYRGDSERQKMEEIPKPMSETFWATRRTISFRRF